MMRARIELGTEAARQEQEAHDVAQVVRAELSWTPPILDPHTTSRNIEHEKNIILSTGGGDCEE